MDISKVDAVQDLDSAVCEINDDRGEYLFSLVIAGPTHANSRKHAESEGRSLAHQGKAMGNIQKAIDARTEGVLTDTDLAVSKQVKTLMARTLDWVDITDKGKPIPFDPKIVKAWYEEKAWLRDRVFTFIGESRNFVKGSSNSSSPTPSTSSN
jgi:hypothetical protein